MKRLLLLLLTVIFLLLLRRAHSRTLSLISGTTISDPKTGSSRRPSMKRTMTPNVNDVSADGWARILISNSWMGLIPSLSDQGRRQHERTQMRATVIQANSQPQFQRVSRSFRQEDRIAEPARRRVSGIQLLFIARAHALDLGP
jgi:hypothetical protein